MKSGKLFIFIAMLALALGVLTATAYAAPPGPDTDMRPVKPEAPAGGIESLSGSFVVFDPSAGGDTCYTPGTAQTFCFRAESFTTDWEWVYSVWQRFPTDWTVTNVYVQGTPYCDYGGSWGAFGWAFETPPYEVGIGHGRNQANPSDHCTAYYCFDVVSGTGSPDALESWYWEGDGYGSAPHHPCSSDFYTPASMANEPCDEWINPQASIPLCQQPYEWLKFINGVRWTPDIQVTVQTSDTIQVTEIVTTNLPFNLVENWNPAHLQLLNYEVSPGGIVNTGPGFLEWHQTPTGPGPWYIIKWFHVEPCDWTDTVLDEVLFVDVLPPEPRPVPIFKVPPLLWINALYQPPVIAGQPANFALRFGNDGGYENNVMIRNDFPPQAPFMSSTPPPSRVGAGGLWVEWDVGDLPQGAMGNIDVTVQIMPGVPPSTTINIVDIIFDHIRVERARVNINFHVVPVQISWDKTIDGIPWQPGMQITRQTSDTIVVQEVLHLMQLPPAGSMPFVPVNVEGQGGKTSLTLSSPVHPLGTPEVSANPEAVLWDQPLSTVNQAAYVDQDFPEYPTFSAFLADDFVNTAPWAIQTIFIPGDGWNGFTTLLNATALTWQIYADCGGVPCGDPSGGGSPPVWNLTLAPTDPQVTISAGTPGGYPSNTSLSPTTPPYLPSGHWWLVFYPTMSFGSYGQYGRQPADTANGYTAQFINPGGGFGYGTVWQAWTVLGMTQTDIAFRLEGIASPPVVAQIETWDPTRLHLLDWVATGGQVIVEPNRLVWTNAVVAPATITLTKWFHVEPCTWTQTVLWEELWLDQVELEQRPVVVNKLPPELWIDAAYQPGVLSGFPASFILSYGNTGGFDNDVWVRNNFPPEAPFVSSLPPPTNVDPGGLWAEWYAGGLPMGFQDNIDVTVMIQPGLPPSTTIEIWDGIFDHTGELRDWVVITFHVEQAFEWIKLVNGVPWDPNMVVTVQTSDTIVITDTVASPLDYHLVENWNPAHLQLVNWAADCGTVIVEPGHLEWFVIPGMPPCTLTKVFHVEPCTWTDTILDEVLIVDGLEPVFRPVPIYKLPPELWIDAQGGGPVLAGQEANFALLFGNTGGFENDVMIRNDFPPTALFVRSNPPPSRVDPAGLWAEWDIPVLPMGAQDGISLTVMIQPGLPPSTTIEIWDGIFDHTGELRDWVIITFHVEQPPLTVEWEKYVDGVPWTPGMEITRQTSDTIEVVEVIHAVLAPPPESAFVPVNVKGQGGKTSLTLSAPGRPLGTPEQAADPEAILWDQPLSTVNQGAYVDQDFPDFATFSSFLADDFVNPYPWYITTIFIPGNGWNGFSSLFNATALTWQVYGDCAGVPCGDPSGGGSPPVWTLTLPPGDAQVVISTGTPGGYPSNTTLNLATPLTLPAGHWWLVFYPTMSLGTGGQFGRQPSDTTNGYVGQFINPGGGFGLGTVWQAWMVLGLSQTDIAFRLEGPCCHGPSFAQIETWDPSRLHLVDWEYTGGEVAVEPDRLVWSGELIEPTTITLTKWFHVEPCTWTVTTLWEELWLNGVELEQRPVVIHKLPASLWIDAMYTTDVHAGEPAQFTLLYGNAGGYENDVWIRNDFPPEAPFVSSVPPPTNADPNWLWAEWYIGDLATGDDGTIGVTVMIQAGLPPSTYITIVDYIFDHTMAVADQVEIILHVIPPYQYLYLPLIFRNYTP